MTALTVRTSEFGAIDRALVALGLAMVRLGRARAARHGRAVARRRAVEAAQLRRAESELRMLALLGPRR